MGKKILFQIGLTNSFSSYLPGTRDCQSPGSLAALKCPSTEARLQAHILFPCCREWSSQFGPRSDTDRFSRCFQRDAQDQMLQRQTIWEPWHLGPLIGIFERLWLMMGSYKSKINEKASWSFELSCFILDPFPVPWDPFLWCLKAWAPWAGFPICALAIQSVSGMVEGKGLGKQSSRHEAQCQIRPFKMRILHPA